MKKVTTNTKGEKIVPAGVTGEGLKKMEGKDIPAEVRAAQIEKEKVEAEKKAAKEKAEAEKAEAKLKVKAEKEAAKAELEEAKKIAADAKAVIKAEKAEALEIAKQAKIEANKGKEEEKLAAKAKREADKLAKLEAKANKQPTGADLIRADYAAFVPTEEKPEYDMKDAAVRLGVTYGRVYGCIAKVKDEILLQAAIAKIRAEKAAQA